MINFSEIFFSEDDASNVRLNQALKNDAIDANYGFNRTNDSAERTGYLLNIQAVIFAQFISIKI